MARLRVFAITGASGNGKTTVLEHMIRALAERGWRVATCKDCSSKFELDRPGSDSARLACAGSEAVWLQSTGRWALLGRVPARCSPVEGAHLTPQALAEATAAIYAALRCPPPHLILVEGFHSWRVPSAHVLGPRNRPAGPGCLAYVLGPLLAPGEADRAEAHRLPVFRWDDGAGLATLVERALGLHRPDRPTDGPCDQPRDGPCHQP